MGGYVRIMILVDERLDGLTLEHAHVLSDWINRLHVVFNRHELVGVLYAQYLDHLTVQYWQVINLGCLACQLQHGLVLHDALGHRATVRVANRDHIHQVVVRLLDLTILRVVRLVAVLLWGVVADDLFQ